MGSVLHCTLFSYFDAMIRVNYFTPLNVFGFYIKTQILTRLQP
jgi:hypothetical protein